MNKILKMSCLLSLAFSSNLLAEDYNYDKVSLGLAHYKLDSRTSENGYEIKYRTSFDNVVFHADYSKVEIYNVDVSQYVISAGYAVSNTKERITAIGISLGEARANDYDIKAKMKAINLIHSYQALDSLELNTRLSKVLPDDSDNYFEAEIGFSYYFADNFGFYSSATLTDASEKIYSLGANIRF
jgi:hypothetical protein